MYVFVSNPGFLIIAHRLFPKTLSQYANLPNAADDIPQALYSGAMERKKAKADGGIAKIFGYQYILEQSVVQVELG